MSLQNLRMAIEDVDGAKVVEVRENRTGETVDGMPPHSIVFVVDGGDSESILVAISMHTPWGVWVHFSRPVQEGGG